MLQSVASNYCSSLRLTYWPYFPLFGKVITIRGSDLYSKALTRTSAFSANRKRLILTRVKYVAIFQLQPNYNISIRAQTHFAYHYCSCEQR